MVRHVDSSKQIQDANQNADWDAQPINPTKIRLIFLGGLLDDKTALKGMCIP
jgi:hypothetical protein